MKFLIRNLIKLIGVLAAGFLLWQAVVEFHQRAPAIGPILGKYSYLWAAAFIVWLGICAILFIGACTLAFTPHRLAWFKEKILAWRIRLGIGRWLVSALLVLSPAVFFLFTNWGSYFESPAIRVVILLISGLGTAVLVCNDEKDLFSGQELGFGFLLSASVFLAAKQLVLVTNYPFALGWSEGNRLYDYSIILGGSRYIYAGALSSVRADIGRQLLWGLPFLIPNSPIWLHRLWNAVLAFIPSLIFGYFLSRWIKLPRIGQWAFTFWVYLFLAQGPIYTPLILSAIVIVALVRWGKWIVSNLAAGTAGYYASLSRFIWLPASPTWAGFILLADLDLPASFPKTLEKASTWLLDLLRHILPVILVVATGLVGGLLANPLLFQPKQLSQGTTLAQPLLWYRLLPNVNYPEGVLIGLLMACGPVVVVLIWLAASRRWEINWIQAFTYPAANLIFLAGGLVASVKIGGGNNLHNLDMFLVSLTILGGLATRDIKVKTLTGWPVLLRAMLALSVVFPIWSATISGTKLSLPTTDQTKKALDLLRARVGEASQKGEVLFMDQRQLLTFGEIQGVALVPDYEKKFVMDNAMAGKSGYFEQFYRDLANKRFTLIITDPLFTKIKDSSYAFGEENNAWVEYVAKPLLCYYAPVRGSAGKLVEVVNIQLLVPRSNPNDCKLPVDTSQEDLNQIIFLTNARIPPDDDLLTDRQRRHPEHTAVQAGPTLSNDHLPKGSSNPGQNLRPSLDSQNEK
jgi:hypothetical protein